MKSFMLKRKCFEKFDLCLQEEGMWCSGWFPALLKVMDCRNKNKYRQVMSRKRKMFRKFWNWHQKAFGYHLAQYDIGIFVFAFLFPTLLKWFFEENTRFYTEIEDFFSSSLSYLYHLDLNMSVSRLNSERESAFFKFNWHNTRGKRIR